MYDNNDLVLCENKGKILFEHVCHAILIDSLVNVFSLESEGICQDKWSQHLQPLRRLRGKRARLLHSDAEGRRELIHAAWPKEVSKVFGQRMTKHVTYTNVFLLYELI